jgi:DNA replication protein DnaC
LVCGSTRRPSSCPRLGKAKRDGTLETMLRDIGRADLIILDWFGYVPFDIDGARLL